MKTSLRHAATPHRRSRPRVNDRPKRPSWGQHPRRQFLHLAAGAAALPAMSRIARAQTYPSRTVTMIVPFAAGGPTDVSARIVAERMSRTLGQQIIIDNVLGAGGTTGSIRAMQANPDGYTIEMGQLGTHAVGRLLSQSSLPARGGFRLHRPVQADRRHKASPPTKPLGRTVTMSSLIGSSPQPGTARVPRNCHAAGYRHARQARSVRSGDLERTRSARQGSDAGFPGTRRRGVRGPIAQARSAGRPQDGHCGRVSARSSTSPGSHLCDSMNPSGRQLPGWPNRSEEHAHHQNHWNDRRDAGNCHRHHPGLRLPGRLYPMRRSLLPRAIKPAPPNL
jgi:Tripartite tricarboxylate transporter family receptor